ncbi:CoA transferase [Novosphingobium colocasiae]
MKTEQGREALKVLVRDADAVVENFSSRRHGSPGRRL